MVSVTVWKLVFLVGILKKLAILDLWGCGKESNGNYLIVSRYCTVFINCRPFILSTTIGEIIWKLLDIGKLYVEVVDIEGGQICVKVQLVSSNLSLSLLIYL